MKTTPKPRATKKSKGELVGPPPLSWLPPLVDEGMAELVVLDDIVYGESHNGNVSDETLGRE